MATLTNEQIEYWGEVFLAAGLRAVGMTFHEFLQDPVQAMASLPRNASTERWAGGRLVSATTLADEVGRGPEYDAANHAARQKGEIEHARFDLAVRRLMGRRRATAEPV